MGAPRHRCESLDGRRTTEALTSARERRRETAFSFWGSHFSPLGPLP